MRHLLLMAIIGILGCNQKDSKQTETDTKEVPVQTNQVVPAENPDTLMKPPVVAASKTIPLADGQYNYEFYDVEYNLVVANCIVVVNGDSIKVVGTGSGRYNKDEVLDEGILVKHTTTGKWLIARSPKDKDTDADLDFGWLDIKKKLYCSL